MKTLSDLKKILFGSGILAGTIIGAGIFSLPYVFSKSGFLAGTIYLVFLAGVFILLYLMYADIILATPGKHQFVGETKRYLGFFGYGAAVLTSIGGLFLTLTVYLILSPSFINLIFTQPVNYLAALVIFWFLANLGVVLGKKTIGFEEVLMTLGIILIAAVLFFLGLKRFNGINFINWRPIYFFLPYGPLIFSLAGRVAIPEVVRRFNKNPEDRRLLKNSVILGVALPAIIYFVFIVAVAGLSLGPIGITPDAVSGLINNVGRGVLIAVGFLGFLALISSYIIISLNLKETLILDFKMPPKLTFLLVIFSPLLLYLVGLRNFLSLVGFIGGVFIALEAILIILMWRMLSKTKNATFLIRLPKFLIYFLLIVFSLGIIYQIIY